MEHTSSIATNNNWCYQSLSADTDFIYLYLCAILVTLSNRSESNLIINYRMIPEFTFTFIVKPTKLKQYEFEEQLYNK